MEKKTTKDVKRGPGRPKKSTNSPGPTPPASGNSSRTNTPPPTSPKTVSFVNYDAPTIPAPVQTPAIEVRLASELENPPKAPPQLPVDPGLEAASREELRNATIQAIAQKQAEASHKRINQSASEAAKLRKEIQHDIEESDLMWGQKMVICNALNAYRQKYASVLSYPFKKDYTPDMEYAWLVSQKQQVELILNTQHAPTIAKDAMVKIAELFEIGSIAIGYPYLNLSGFKSAMEETGKTGFFDDEIEQLCIKYAHWFNRPPEYRLAGKVGLVAAKVVINNADQYQAQLQARKVNPASLNNPKFSGL